MPFYYDQGGTDRYTLQDFEPSFSAKLGAAINESWAESYGPVLTDWAKKKVAGGPKLSAEDAQSVIDGAGFKLNIKPTDNEYSESELNVMIDRQRELTIAKDVRDRTPWDFGSPVRGLAMFGAGIVDPINLATAFVPWTKMVSGARALEAARLSASAATRFGGRAGLGAIEGGISTAVLEPFYAGMRRSLGDDYDAVDSMANIAFGTAFGGGVVGIGGVGVDAFRKATGRAAPSDRFRGMNVDEIQQVQALEADVRAGRSQFETVDEFTQSDVGTALQKRIDEAPQSVRRALGVDVEAPVVGADGRKQSPMSSKIVDLDANTIAAQSDASFISARVDGNIMSIIGSRTDEPMRGRGFGTALYERLVNEGLDRGMKVQSESQLSAADARKYAALEKLGFVVERNENATEFAPIGDTLPEGGISTPDGSPVFTVTRGEGYVKPVDRAIDVANRIDPETREAAFRAGTAQLVDGRVLSLDTIINSDPNSGAVANANDIEAAAKLNQAPESIRVADFDASAKVEQENAASQKWDSLSDAEQALAEADVQLNNTIKAGDDAFKYSRDQKPDTQVTQVNEVKTEIEQAGGTVVAAADVDTVVRDSSIPVITLKDLIDKKLFPTIADRTAAGTLFTGIDSSQLQIYIPLLGGPLFPLRTSNISAGVVWANRGKGVTSQKAAKLKEGANYMLVVLGDANMHQSNSTVSNAFFGTFEAYVRDGRISADNATNLLKLIRDAGDADPIVAKSMAEFPEIDKIDVLTKYIDDLSFNGRSRLLNILGSKKAQAFGAPPLQKILDATREPEFAGNRWGDGVLVVEVDQQNLQVDLGTQGTMPHPDYPLGIKGRVVGRLEVPVNYELLYEDWLAQARIDAIARGTAPEKVGVRRAFELAKPIVEITKALVKRIGTLRQENISSPKQARMAADIAANNWKTSDAKVKEGGISPQLFVDAIDLAPSGSILAKLDIETVTAGIKDKSLKLYQLGDAQTFFALQTVGDKVNLVALVNNEQGARGFSASIIAKAIEEGATNVDVHAIKSAQYPLGFLPTLYKSMGFSVVKESPTPDNLYQGTKLKDAVQFWKQTNPDFDVKKDGIPPVVTLEFTNGNRANATKRYIKSGIAGLLGGGDEANGKAVADRLLGTREQAVAGGEQAEQGGVAGIEAVSNVRPVESGARAAIESISKLKDNELKNLGLTVEDRKFAKSLLKYAQGKTDQTPDSDALTFALAESFGGDTVKLLETGQIRIVATPNDIPNGPHPDDVKAATAPDGTVYIIAQNTTAKEAKGIVLHEVGVHVGMERMLGADLFNNVLTQLDNAIMRGESWAQAARDNVPDGTLPQHIREEQLGYLVQNSPDLPLVKQIIAAVRMWAYKNFEFVRDLLTLNEADFRALAVSSLQFAARQDQLNGGRLNTAFSRVKSYFDELTDDQVDELLQEDGIAITNKDEADGLWSRGFTIYAFPEQDESPIKITDRAVLERYAPDRMLALSPESIQEYLKNTNDQFNSDVQYARGEVPDPAVAKTEIEVADANIKRVRSYSNVLRAAADKLDDDASAVAAMKSQLPDITAQEIDDLLIGLRTQVKNLRSMTRAAREAVMSGDKADMMQTDAMQAADLLANNLEKAAVIERRNAALNVAARLKASSFVNQFRAKGLDFEGFAALLVGSQRVRTGARMSIDAEYKGYRSELVGGMLADVEKAGLLREFVSGTFDRDIYDALWRMGQDKPDMTGINPQAMQLAEILNKYQTNARNNRNRFGAWIRDLQGYITRQSHDMYKIRAVSEDEWANFLKDRLDLPKMMRLGLISETDPMGSLRGLYDDFASGLHMKNIPAEEDSIAMGRGSNLAKRESVSRTLYFKDGLSAFEYNQLYGVGTLAQSVVVGLDRAASSTALLKTLGTNPEVTLTRIMDEYENSLTGDRRAKFRQSRGAITNLLGQVDGSVNIPGNVNAAKVGAFLRAWQSMARLGGALISSVSDLAGYAAELRYSEGKNLFAGVMDGVVALTKGRATGEQADILASLGVFHESIAGSVSARFDNPDLVGGKMAAAMQQFFKLNGLTWWTETLRDAAALQHSSYMALQSTKKFADLDPELNRLLGLYNIGEAKWDLIRMAVTQIEDGRKYLNPEALKTIPRSALEQYIASIGRTVSDTSVQNLLDDLAQTMRVMFVDRAHHAVLEPNARVRGFMLRGTKPGTVPGEIMRYIGQFKSFSIAMVQMVLGREVYGRGYDTVGEYLRNGRGDMVGLAAMITMYGALGYIAMSIKDLIKGREPRDPTDPKTVIAAFAQGGGLGLYGDFLFGEYSRMGRTFTASLAGPVIGNLDTLTDLWTRLRNGDDVAAQSFKALIDNTPFANLYWLRPLLDYSILFNIQESLNPGFLRRMEQRVERENSQSFILKPSEVIR